MIYLSKISSLIKEYRFNNEISQKDFAAMCNISQTHLSQIEGGIRKPGFDVCLRICKILNICPYTLEKCNIINILHV